MYFALKRGGTLYRSMSAFMMHHRPPQNSILPWPTSPYINPKMKGKVVQASRAGFASWYRGTPYVSMTSCHGSVNSLTRIYVGGDLVLRWGTKNTSAVAGPHSRRTLSLRTF